MRTLLALVAAVTFSACGESGPPATPPEGWVAADPTRWYVPGTDTSAAFRDLSTIEAMGVVREDEGELVRWVQERMTDLYRTAPEVVDSVFAAEYLDEVRAGVPDGGDYGTEAAGLLNRVKRDFFSRYNGSRYTPSAEPLVVPDSLVGTPGRAVVQVYVDENSEPVAVKLTEGTGTALDQLFMRHVLGGSYSDGWVLPSAGRVGGVNIPTYVHVPSVEFGP